MGTSLRFRPAGRVSLHAGGELREEREGGSRGKHLGIPARTPCAAIQIPALCSPVWLGLPCKYPVYSPEQGALLVLPNPKLEEYIIRRAELGALLRGGVVCDARVLGPESRLSSTRLQTVGSLRKSDPLSRAWP